MRCFQVKDGRFIRDMIISDSLFISRYLLFHIIQMIAFSFLDRVF